LTSFKRIIKGKEVNIEIYNTVRNFEKSDWKRVIAVFVQGVEWEFKDWPKSETIISILLKIKGFYLKYHDSPLNENCRKWNVKILEIHRNKRHFDGSVNNEFWSAMEEFLNLPRYREKNMSKTIN
jgi:parafibromin